MSYDLRIAMVERELAHVSTQRPTFPTIAPDRVQRTIDLVLRICRQDEALVHRIDSRSEHLSKLGAEVVEGDLLDFLSVRSAL